MTVVSTTDVRTISSTDERDKVLKIVKEIANSMARIEGERGFIKDATDTIVKEHKLPKKIVNRLIKTFYRQNFDEQVAIEEAFKNLYVQVTGGK